MASPTHRLGNSDYTGMGKSPYQNKRSDALNYDLRNITTTTIVIRNPANRMLPPHEACSHWAAGHLPLKEGQRVLDIGGGTGITAAAVLERNPGVHVVSVEKNKAYVELARYKFNQRDGKKLLAELAGYPGDEQALLGAYFSQFRSNTKPVSCHVKFIVGDFTARKIKPGFDLAVANQSVHWIGVSETFEPLYPLLNNGGSFVWTTASHFVRADFDPDRYSMRYNDFTRKVLDILSKSPDFPHMNDLSTLSRPSNSVKSIQKLTEAKGFKTRHLKTELIYYDLSILIKDYIPVFVDSLIKARNPDFKPSPEQKEDIGRRVQDAVAQALQDRAALSDLNHKYDFVIIFESKKIG